LIVLLLKYTNNNRIKLVFGLNVRRWEILNSIEFRRQKLINSVAKDLSFEGFDYNKTIEKMQEIGIFSTWDEWELYNRPVNIEELKGILS